MPERDLKGRVALVTGASSGIGREIASALLEQGVKVALCARREERLSELAARYPAEQTLACRVDLRRETEILAAFAAVRERWGGVDLLVNAAGLGRKAPLTEGSSEAWRQMLEVNVLGLCICTREALQDMRARGDDGHVVHISSMSAHRVPEGSGVYSATKFAVRSLTEGLRQELRALGSRIRVSSVSPGFVQTEFAEVFHGSVAAAEEIYGRMDVLQPQDVAATVMHLLKAPAHVAVHDVLMRPTEQRS